MNSHEIWMRLKRKHADDLILGEVKNGRTTTARAGELKIMDAWAMKRSWSPVTMIGYEIKVSRSDFVGDSKWPSYLKLCHQLYFVAPTGVIHPEELPAEVGLMVTAGTQSLITKKKAPYRQIEPPSQLMVYLLMCRVVPGSPNIAGVKQDREFWMRWLEEKREDMEIGASVAGKIHDLVRRVKTQLKAIQDREKALEVTERVFREVGITPSDYEWVVRRQLEGLRSQIQGSNVEQAIDHAERAIAALKASIAAVKGGGNHE